MDKGNQVIDKKINDGWRLGCTLTSLVGIGTGWKIKGVLSLIRAARPSELVLA